MGCPYHDDSEASDSDNEDDAALGGADDRGVDRREFMKSALVIGGTSALTSAIGLYGTPGTATADLRVPSYAERYNRQHAWDAYERPLPDHEQTPPPQHHLLLHTNYVADGEPKPGHRRQAARAFDDLSATFGWGNGGGDGPATGVLFTVGYSPGYFDRFRDEASEVVMPEGLDPEKDGGLADKQGLVRPGPLIEATTYGDEDPVADQYDAVIHMASDDARALLAAEEALWGADVEGYGSLAASLEGVFTKPTEYPARRVGFAGHDNLEDMSEFDQVRTGEERADGVYPSDIPEGADLSMGFNDVYKNSVPRETNATILEDQQLVEPKPPGVFAQGTIQHVSKLDIDLDRWYEYDTDQRRERMFSPEHDAENTGEVGENLGNSNAPGDEPMRDLSRGDGGDVAERTERHARERGVAGHAQKTARARFDLESRITDEGIETYRGLDRYDAATERDDDLPGHDGDQEAEQVVLRRDFDTTDQDQPGNHFVALMRFNPYMAYLRAAMNGVDFDTSTFGLPTGEDSEGFVHDSVDDLAPEADGIVDFLETKRRGNYLVPPLRLRALPPASGDEVEITVAGDGGHYRVTVAERQGQPLDPDTVGFGHYLDVNRARGANPVAVERERGRQVFVFEQADTELESGDTVRLFGKRQDSRRPVRGTVESFEPGTAGGESGNRGNGRH